MNCVATATLLHYLFPCLCLAFTSQTPSSRLSLILKNETRSKSVPHSGHWLSKWWTKTTPATPNGKQFYENEEESIDEAKMTTVRYH